MYQLWRKDVEWIVLQGFSQSPRSHFWKKTSQSEAFSPMLEVHIQLNSTKMSIFILVITGGQN